MLLRFNCHSPSHPFIHSTTASPSISLSLSSFVHPWHSLMYSIKQIVITTNSTQLYTTHRIPRILKVSFFVVHSSIHPSIHITIHYHLENLHPGRKQRDTHSDRATLRDSIVPCGMYQLHYQLSRMFTKYRELRIEELATGLNTPSVKHGLLFSCPFEYRNDSFIR